MDILYNPFEHVHKATVKCLCESVLSLISKDIRKTGKLEYRFICPVCFSDCFVPLKTLKELNIVS
jgi:hypothetical protein